MKSFRKQPIQNSRIRIRNTSDSINMNISRWLHQEKPLLLMESRKVVFHLEFFRAINQVPIKNPKIIQKNLKTKNIYELFSNEQLIFQIA